MIEGKYIEYPLNNSKSHQLFCAGELPNGGITLTFDGPQQSYYQIAIGKRGNVIQAFTSNDEEIQVYQNGDSYEFDCILPSFPPALQSFGIYTYLGAIVPNIVIK